MAVKRSVAPGSEADVPEVRPVVRSDVRRNRQALLDAARELLTARSDVPMYEVAKRAGVGQATLYRHFPDRGAMVAAVAAEYLAALEAEVAALAPGPEALKIVLRRTAELVAESGAVTEVVLQETEVPPDAAPDERVPVLRRLQEKVSGLFDMPIREARAAGIVAADFGVPDVVYVLAMVKGAIDTAGNDLPGRRASAARALDLALHGLLIDPPSPPGARPPRRSAKARPRS